ncbi:hypothetical protein C1645_873734 [Glomus cerebriforme]|uniref:F-box domain-containing protein n=1 Tax=Glomus cerebriforme TaxID=658196 RepID=A0A397T6J3_9GLOM|nr:hypothetical protein C1645_873734 [Glomus cerebriforme]
MSFLPVEVIDIIINYIDECDLSTLLNISLVDRKWCLIGIRRLWSFPFIKVYNKKRLEIYSKIITILLSFLDNETKSFLKIDGLFDIPFKTSFDYPSFIRQIDFVILRDLIYSWLEQNKFSPHSINQEIDYENENNHFLSFNYKNLNDGFQITIETLIFFEILFKLIIRKSQGINILRIVSFKHEFPLTYPYTLIKLEESQRCLSRLKQFKCKGDFLKKPLMLLITEISHEISTFSLSLSNDSLLYKKDLKTSHVSSFLKSQTKLKNLSVRSNDLVTFKYLKGVKKIIRKTLQEIKLFEGDLDYRLKKLLKCSNLRRICFYNLNLFENQSLGHVVFPNLKDLEIINCNFLLSDEPSPIISFLINNGSNLLKIRLSMIPDDQISRFLLKIPQYCPNLVTLSVDLITKSDLQNFYQVLLSCNNLKNVDFGNKCKWQHFVNEYILYLNKISPSNLRKLRVRYWIVHIKSFKRFFKKYGSFVNEFECPCTEGEVEIRSLVMSLVKKMNRTLVSLLIEEVEFQMISVVKIRLK